jgi:hypothetical protein
MFSEWRLEETNTSAGWLGGNYPIVEIEFDLRKALLRCGRTSPMALFWNRPKK